MPRKTKKQKIKVTINKQKEFNQLSLQVNTVNSFSSDQSESENSNQKPKEQISTKDKNTLVFKDILKSLLIFIFLAIVQYILYYGIINNIIKI